MLQVLSYAYQLETLGGYTKRFDGSSGAPRVCKLDVFRIGFEIAE